MIAKYTLPEMGGIWSEENKYQCWLRVEIAVAESWADEGRVPAEALPGIRAATFDPARIEAIEVETRHDLIAFLRNLAENVGPDARWIHLGLTSSDVVDTALSLQLRDSTDLLLRRIDALSDALRKSARQYRGLVMMGRTHNVHAEPITFGYKLAVWFGEIQRHRIRLERVRVEIAIAKIAGAVGTHADVPPVIEEQAARRLGLAPEAAATQVMSRDRHAAYVLELALLASSLDKMATEFRNLQHSEILEIEEPFAEGQQGSSAMPHKRNPILSERLSGLARVVRGYAVPALENVVLWHERDISNSSVERLVLPDASILTDYMLWLLTWIIANLHVNEDRMARNLDLSRGRYFSGGVLTALIDNGLSRTDAYELVQRASSESSESGDQFREVLERDEKIMSHLTPGDVERIFDAQRFLRNIDEGYRRLGFFNHTDQESRPIAAPA